MPDQLRHSRALPAPSKYFNIVGLGSFLTLSTSTAQLQAYRATFQELDMPITVTYLEDHIYKSNPAVKQQVLELVQKSAEIREAENQGVKKAIIRYVPVLFILLNAIEH